MFCFHQTIEFTKNQEFDNDDYLLLCVNVISNYHFHINMQLVNTNYGFVQGFLNRYFDQWWKSSAGIAYLNIITKSVQLLMSNGLKSSFISHDQCLCCLFPTTYMDGFSYVSWHYECVCQSICSNPMT